MSLLLLFGGPATVNQSGTDSGLGSDSAVRDVLVLQVGTDAGTGTDDASKAVAEFGIDSGVGTDTSSLARVFYVVESGTGTDSFALAIVYFFTHPVEVYSSMSANIRQASPTTADPLSRYIRLDGTAAAEVRALVDVERAVPLGVGAQVLHADLILHKAAAWANSGTITVEPLDATWDGSTVTWNTAPAVRAQSASVLVASGGADGDVITIDITPLLASSVSADDASGTRWYGVRLKVDSAGEKLLHGASSDPDWRPYVLIEWSIPPVAPEDLQPTSGLVVSKTLPELVGRFYDPDVGDSMTYIQVQVSTDDTFATTHYDSGKIAASVPRFDLSAPPAGAPACTALTPGTTYYWRMKAWDNHNVESPWPAAASFVVRAKGTLVLTSPAGASVSSPTPAISWTFTPAGVETQAQYYALIEKLVGGVWVEHWLSDWQVGTAAAVTLPNDYRLAEGVSYRATARVLDSYSRADLSGDRSFLEATREFTLAAVA